MSKVVITDEKGNFLKEEEFITSLEEGLIRRIVRIFIFNSKGELFLQKRSDDVLIHPGKWDASAAGHVDHVTEEIIDAAKKELQEELGLKNIRLKKEFSFYNDEGDYKNMKLRCFETIFTATYDGEFNLDNWEVSEGRWIKAEDLDKEIDTFPERFSSGFINSCKKYKKFKTRNI